ncbi:PAS domain S-box protein [Sedimentisphaera salicampi]|uniref:histidine kinase n=1 Tax=Sedimentisphaera salicampi TaxID=1941349 RepID=A0A1W6LKM9_9BACT|nr:PAS domain S-box protein [Sedimentisphaera salicampi]ARN56350.1 Oxygen sensor histidine kinase NreB [Sedimentisphaera salicampi]
MKNKRNGIQGAKKAAELIPVSKAVRNFILTITVLTGLVVCFFVVLGANTVVKSLDQRACREKTLAADDIFNRFIDNHYMILKDYADFPLITQAVMQPKSNLSSVGDFMKTLSFFGRKYQLTLLDCFGSRIKSTKENPLFDYSSQQWMQRLAEGEIEKFSSVSRQGRNFFFRVVSPVDYKGTVQGFLVLEIPVDEIVEQSSLKSLLSGSHLAVYSGSNLILQIGTRGSSVEHMRKNADLGLKFEYSHSRSQSAEAVALLTVKLLLILLAFVAVNVMIGMYFGNKFFARPLEVFRQAAADFAKHRKSFRPEQIGSKIRELELLAREFSSMEMQIVQNESELGKARKHLEERVIERTKELNEANAEILTSVRRWQATFNSSQSLIIVYDENLNIVKANRAAEKFLNSSADKLMGRHFSSVFGSCEIEDGFIYSAEAVLEKGGHSWEMYFKECERWMLSNLDPIYAENGSISGAVQFLQDITDLREAQKQVTENAERLSLALEGSGLGLWDWQIKTGKIKIDSRWAGMLGYEIEDIPEKIEAWSQRIHPDDYQRVMDELRKAMRGEVDQYHVEHRLKTKSGEYKWILDSGRIIEFDELGEPLRMAGIHQDINESKLLTEKLKQSEANLSSFFNSVDSLFSVLDMQGNIIEVNQPLLNKLGYSREEIIGRNILICHPEQYRKEAGENVEQMLKGKRESCPLPLAAKDGTIIPAESYVIKGIWNGKQALFGISKDISQLKESEEKFAKAFNSSPLLMALSTVESGKFIDVNDTFLNVLGFERDEVIGKTSQQLRLFEDVEKRHKTAEKTLQQGYVRESELKVRKKNGEKLIVLFSSHLINTQRGKILLTAANDVTQLRENQRMLRESEQRLSGLISSITDCMFIVNNDFRISWTNETAAGIFGGVEGLKWNSVFKNADVEEGILAAAFNDGEIHDCEVEIKPERKSSAMNFWCTVSPVKYSNGITETVVVVCRDITKRKEYEAALSRSRQILEQKVEQRTKEIDNSKKELRELYIRLNKVQEDERKQISREIHDQLGTILTTLKYDLAWVKNKAPGSDEQSELLESKINQMSDKIDGIIETVQRISSQLRPGLLDDMGLPAAIEWQAEKFAETADIMIDTEFDESIKFDSECSTAVFRIFQELMTNVLRHAKASFVLVKLYNQGQYAKLDVIDNGIGIKDAAAFDKNSLGLIGIRERANVFGGSFSIASAAEGGTVASVFIPLEK